MAAGRSSSYADRVGRQFEQQFGRPASADDPEYAAYIRTAMPQMIDADRAALARSQGRWNTVKKIAFGAAAVPFAAAAAPALFGGAAAGGATTAGSVNGLAITPYAGTVAASGTGGGSAMGFSLGRLLGSRGFEALANGATSLLGMRSQNNANRYATDVNARLTAEQLAMERERLAREQAAADADRADAKARWDAEQAMAARQFAASEDERAYNRQLLEAREARRAMYDPYRQNAMRSLGAILGIRS